MNEAVRTLGWFIAALTYGVARCLFRPTADPRSDADAGDTFARALLGYEAEGR